MEDKTLTYYNENSHEFVNSTVMVDMSPIRKKFLSRVKIHGHILDLGCGSGRDSLSFRKLGYTITAVDGSPVLCEIASKLIGQNVLLQRFEDIDYVEEFDGIWACSSLLHVAYAELPFILKRLYRALKPSGTLYLSFKYGAFEGERNGRYFTDCDEKRLKHLIDESGGFRLIEQWITEDARPARDEYWLNALCSKQ